MSEYRGRHSAPLSNTSASDLDDEQSSSTSTSTRTAASSRYRVRNTRGANPYVAVRSRTGKGSGRQPSVLGTSGGSSKRKLITTIIAAVILLAVIGGLAFGGFKLYHKLFDGEEPIAAGQPVTITIPNGAGASEIAQILKDNGVVDSQTNFLNEVIIKGADDKLKPGTYQMTTGMDYDTVIDMLVAGPEAISDGYILIVPENFNLELVAARVENVSGGAITAPEFISEAHSADKYLADYPFLEGAYNNSLEGFLFPKTYSIPATADAEYIVRVMLDQFALETANLDLSYAESQGLSFYDVLIIGSLIEKEAKVDNETGYDERGLVSSVIYNRLADDYPLQLCSSVVYVLGTDRDYAAHPLTYDDIAIDSPYNTYIYGGLPPGPICSPGLASLQAAAHPEETDYYFFVLNPETGHDEFSVSQEEHEAKVAIYGELNYSG
ncbi:MAG: endolytic transglycosylase MltG [Coriobacteriales bacterium]|jgi:UPF0755 protein|nr:endolytic transglycosylase MltG [Coriobacteriales bacterium]